MKGKAVWVNNRAEWLSLKRKEKGTQNRTFRDPNSEARRFRHRFSPNYPAFQLSFPCILEKFQEKCARRGDWTVDWHALRLKAKSYLVWERGRITSTRCFERMKWFFFPLFQFFFSRINALLGVIRELMIYSLRPVAHLTPLASTGLKHKCRNGNTHLTKIQDSLLMSLSLYTWSYTPSSKHTHCRSFFFCIL